MATDFLTALSNFGDRVSNIDNYLLAIGGQLAEQLKTDAPVDTSDLRNSIQVVQQDNTLRIEMLAYGMFQNYGVAGIEGDSRFGVVEEVPSFITPPPMMSNKYQYKQKRFGIPAQNWFDATALQNAVFNEIENRLEF